MPCHLTLFSNILPLQYHDTDKTAHNLMRDFGNLRSIDVASGFPRGIPAGACRSFSPSTPGVYFSLNSPRDGTPFHLLGPPNYLVKFLTQ
jgi:hypothetical protein